MVSFSLCLRGVRMGMVANKKTIYQMKLMGFRAWPIMGIRVLQGIGLDSLQLPNHRRCPDGFIPIRAGDPQK